ncbi:LysR family transcriptional regulator [Halomonas sp. HMF6819]|uniref:LysR family transcriptional regulator n=1 Tax=unclassified Halomonas TaxID=2609666 RepID=UPI0020769C36|nr:MULTISPECIES: LysR family transcriptional regulator [unclassified Halomonas]
MDRLRAMELFLSISRTHSFTETARLFGVSATSVSRMITNFESSLGVTLLQRSTRQVVLTEAGKEYAQQLDGLLWMLEEAQNSITAISSSPRGVLKVHSRTMFGIGVLTPLIARFRSEYPDITVELTLGEAKIDLREQQIDIDFRVSPPAEASVKRRILFISQQHLVASPAYLESRHLDHKAPLERPEQITDHQCLVYRLPGHRHTWHFKKGDYNEEIEISPRYLINNGIALRELAVRGEGVALLEDYTVYNDIESGRLVRLLPDYQVTNTDFDKGIYATILDTPVIPKKTRLFLDFVASKVSTKDGRFSLIRREKQ